MAAVVVVGVHTEAIGRPEGAEDRVTDTVVRRVTGRPPGSFRALPGREAPGTG